ncbi:MAG: hypothetical protein ACK41D_09615 [Rubricoccaceae bacterium]
MLRLVLFVLAALLAAAPAEAQHAGAFARMGLGARAATLGASAADVYGEASPYHNPALAPFQRAQALEFSAGVLPFGRDWQAVQAGAPLRPRAGIAAGIVRAGMTDIDGRDASGYHTGTLSTDEYAFFVAFGTRLTGRVAGGLGLRFYRADVGLGVRAPSAVGVSAGVAAQLSERVAIGVAAEDLFARYAWNAAPVGGTTTDRFPLRLRAGTAVRAAERVLLTADVEGALALASARFPTGIDVIAGTPAATDSTARYRLASLQGRLGAEWQPAEAFALRAGVDRLGGDALRPSAGFAVRQRLGEAGLRLDYAATLEPFATGVMHLATIRVEL